MMLSDKLRICYTERSGEPDHTARFHILQIVAIRLTSQFEHRRDRAAAKDQD